jgi:hypothetical protein
MKSKDGRKREMGGSLQKKVLLMIFVIYLFVKCKIVEIMLPKSHYLLLIDAQSLPNLLKVF